MQKIFKSAKEAKADADKEHDDWLAHMQFDDEMTVDEYRDILIREQQRKDATS